MARFFLKKVSELDLSMDMWNFTRTLDGRKPPAKSAEPLSRPETPDRAAPSHPAITDREKAKPSVLCQAHAAVSRIPSGNTADLPIKKWKRMQRRLRAPGVQNATVPYAPFSLPELESTLKAENRQEVWTGRNLE